MSTGHGHTHDNDPGHHAPPQETGMASAYVYGLLAIGFLCIVFWARGKWVSGSDEHAEKKNVSVTMSERNIPVDFGREYRKVKGLPGGFRIEFYEATQPYCVSNGIDPEVCSRETEDVDLGKSGNNKVLKIRSRDGQAGHLEIRLTATGE